MSLKNIKMSEISQTQRTHGVWFNLYKNCSFVAKLIYSDREQIHGGLESGSGVGGRLILRNLGSFLVVLVVTQVYIFVKIYT